jgi:hypothetical protein
MQGFSSAFAETIQDNHTAVASAQLVQDGAVIANLEVHAGSVTADRTAAQMRSFEFEIIDRDGTLAPTSMTSPLAPFGSQILLKKGVRNKSVGVQSVVYDAANPWTPQTSTGQIVSLGIDSDGSLTMGQ